MKPRVFVSSTFYDLKYIREDLSNFIKAHDFEPIMFEDGDIGYTPGKELDKSCYEAMRSADMVVLIIGGNYGSKASDENDNFDRYISITRKEFKTAVSSNIPIFVFIDSKIATEYETFDLNQETLKEDPKAIKFKNTKDINVFYFIKEIYQLGNLPITSFSRSEEIKNFLSKQWSDMFKKYLQSLKEEKINDSLNNTIGSMALLLSQMKLMVNKIGEKTIDKEELKSVVAEQDRIKVKKVAELISKGITLEISNEDIACKKENVRKLITSINEAQKENIDLFDSLRKNEINHHCSSYQPFIINHDLTKEVVNDKKCRHYLEELLISDEYYDNIFTNDIKKIIPDFFDRDDDEN